MTRWVYPPCPRQSYVSGVGVLVLAPAPFVLFCCVSCWRNANLAGRFASRRCLAWFFVLFVFIWYCLELWNQGVSHCLPFIYPLLSLLGPSLRAKSAATDGKKTFPVVLGYSRHTNLSYAMSLSFAGCYMWPVAWQKQGKTLLLFACFVSCLFCCVSCLVPFRFFAWRRPIGLCTGPSLAPLLRPINNKCMN